MKPAIGINLCFRPGETTLDDALYLRAAYMQAVIKAGGMPVLMPVVEEMDLLREMFRRIDGLLMTGGDPEYRAMTVEKTARGGCNVNLPDLKTQNPRRHAFDLALCVMALERDMPVLGICRGHQTLNEAAGGTMILNLSRVTRWEHRQQENMAIPTHLIRFTRDASLKEIFSVHIEEMWVNSFHRQAIDQPAPGFVISSYSTDGIAESIESRQHSFVVGVQFHPEMMLPTNQSLNVYNKLIYAALDYRKGCRKR